MPKRKRNNAFIEKIANNGRFPIALIPRTTTTNPATFYVKNGEKCNLQARQQDFFPRNRLNQNEVGNLTKQSVENQVSGCLRKDEANVVERKEKLDDGGKKVWNDGTVEISWEESSIVIDFRNFLCFGWNYHQFCWSNKNGLFRVRYGQIQQMQTVAEKHMEFVVLDRKDRIYYREKKNLKKIWIFNEKTDDTIELIIPDFGKSERARYMLADPFGKFLLVQTNTRVVIFEEVQMLEIDDDVPQQKENGNKKLPENKKETNNGPQNQKIISIDSNSDINIPEKTDEKKDNVKSVQEKKDNVKSVQKETKDPEKPKVETRMVTNWVLTKFLKLPGNQKKKVIRSSNWSPDGQYALIVDVMKDDSHNVYLFDRSLKDYSPSIYSGHKAQVLTAAFNPRMYHHEKNESQCYFATASDDGCVCIWSTCEDCPIVVTTLPEPILHLIWSSKGDKLICCNQEYSFIIHLEDVFENPWDLDKQIAFLKQKFTDSDLTFCEVDGGAKYHLELFSRKQEENAKRRKRRKIIPNHSLLFLGNSHSLNFDPRNRVLTMERENVIQWQINSGHPPIAATKNDNWCAFATGQNVLQVINNKGHRIVPQIILDARCRFIASTNNHLLAIVTDTPTLYVWDIQKQQQIIRDNLLTLLQNHPTYTKTNDSDCISKLEFTSKGTIKIICGAISYFYHQSLNSWMKEEVDIELPSMNPEKLSLEKSTILQNILQKSNSKYQSLIQKFSIDM